MVAHFLLSEESKKNNLNDRTISQALPEPAYCPHLSFLAFWLERGKPTLNTVVASLGSAP
jgi:hypothetical protein